MKHDVFDDIREHYVSVAKELSSQARQAGLLKNSTGVGTEREEVYRAFLERHLPKMCDVFLGGYVFDLRGNTSRQIDIIVTSGNTPRFSMSSGDRFIAPLEGTIAVAEVKSKLDKSSLYDALQSFAEMPHMPSPAGIISPQLRVNQGSWDDIPYKIIVAFDAIEKEILWQHINTFYEKNAGIPIGRRPNILHVIESYVVLRITSSVRVANSDGSISSEQPEVGSYRWFDIGTGTDVLAIVWSLDTIQLNAFISQNVKYDYGSWINQIVDRIRVESNTATDLM